MNPGRAPIGCVMVPLTLGLVWLGMCATWTMFYVRQETNKLQRNSDISAHLQSTQGTMVSANSGGRGMTPSWYQLGYQYATPQGQKLSGSVTITAGQLRLFGLSDHNATFLFAHPKKWMVEYDAVDPKISRLQGVPYNGGSSRGTLWGGAGAGMAIGLGGFLFFSAGILRAMFVKRGKG